MEGKHLSHEDFFAQLSTLLSKTHTTGHGTVHLSQKRLSFDPSTPTTSKIQDDPLWDLHPPNSLPVLIRATDGQTTKSDKKTKNTEKAKLSTIVQPDDLEAFFARYADVCKAGMSGLRKRDRSKRKKEKGKKKKGAGGGEGEKKG